MYVLYSITLFVHNLKIKFIKCNQIIWINIIKQYNKTFTQFIMLYKYFYFN
jgi:hypothetical protein